MDRPWAKKSKKNSGKGHNSGEEKPIHTPQPRHAKFHAFRMSLTHFRLTHAILPAKVLSHAFYYPRDAMLARVFAIATCPSVCLSVCHTPVLCLAERKQDREMYTVW